MFFRFVWRAALSLPSLPLRKLYERRSPIALDRLCVSQEIVFLFAWQLTSSISYSPFFVFVFSISCPIALFPLELPFRPFGVFSSTSSSFPMAAVGPSLVLAPCRLLPPLHAFFFLFARDKLPFLFNDLVRVSNFDGRVFHLPFDHVFLQVCSFAEFNTLSA